MGNCCCSTMLYVSGDMVPVGAVRDSSELFEQLVSNFTQPLQALICGGFLDPTGYFFHNVEVVKGPSDRLALGSVIHLYFSRSVLDNNRGLRRYQQEVRAVFQVVDIDEENFIIQLRRTQIPLSGNVDGRAYGDSPRTIQLTLSSHHPPALRIAMESDVPAGASYRSAKHFYNGQCNSIATFIGRHIRPSSSCSSCGETMRVPSRTSFTSPSFSGSCCDDDAKKLLSPTPSSSTSLKKFTY